MVIGGWSPGGVGLGGGRWRVRAGGLRGSGGRSRRCRGAWRGRLRGVSGWRASWLPAGWGTGSCRGRRPLPRSPGLARLGFGELEGLGEGAACGVVVGGVVDEAGDDG